MKPTRVTVHCSATPNGKEASIDAIRADHRSRGFSDIGYHYLIQPDGSVVKGRPNHVQGAHVEGENEGNLGVCLIGTDKYTRAQWRSLMRLLADILHSFDLKPWDIHTHNDFDSARKQKKDCPGFELGQLLCWYVAGLEQALWENTLG